MKKLVSMILASCLLAASGACATRAAAHRGDRRTERQVSRDIESVDERVESLEKRVEKLEDEVRELKKKSK